jgi:hypothetical protein
MPPFASGKDASRYDFPNLLDRPRLVLGNQEFRVKS